jgi:hypothetical protein
MKIIGVEGLTNEQVQAEVGRDVMQEVMAQVAAPASGAMPMPQT